MNYMIWSDHNSASAYDFAAPITLHWPGTVSRILLEILRTKAVNRLRGISFLGGIDFLFVKNPNGFPGNRRYSRYQHSLGVARLANYYSKIVGLSPDDSNIACIAALLHDVGHAPLSHSLEPVFREEYAIDHHLATKLIIQGDSPFGGEIIDILRNFKIDPDVVMATISGERDGFDGFFSGPINFDTIEGILRSRSYQGIDDTRPSPERVVEAATARSGSRDKSSVDSFWEMKDQAYRTVINSRQGVLADQICQQFLRNNLKRFRRNSYFLNESQLFKRIPKLRKVLKAEHFETEAWTYLPQKIDFKSRRFFVDESVEFDARQDHLRYRQCKVDRTLVAGAGMGVNGNEGIEDLFPYERD